MAPAGTGREGEDSGGPLLSVVIPTLGARRATLDRALSRLAGQEDSPPFEVVVAFDAAAESPGELPAGGARPEDLRTVVADRPGASAARNAGWRAASAPVVLFLDDDILASAGLVAEHAEWHRRHPAENVGVLGLVRWADEVRVTPFMRWVDRGLQFDFGSIDGDEADPGKLYTANVSLKRSLLERAGGFDEVRFPFHFEDVELAYRLAPLGFRLRFNRAAEAEHLRAVTLEQYAERLRGVAAAERRLVEVHPDLDPRMRDRFAAAAEAPSPRGLGARFASIVPEGIPWLGPKVRASAAARFERELAGPYLEAWAEASKPGGASSAGP